MKYRRCTLRFSLAGLVCIWLISGVQAQGRSIVRMGKDVYVEAGRRIESAVAIGGDVIVEGRIAMDAVAVGGSVILEPTAFVAGSAVAVGGQIRQEPGAMVRGDIVEIGIPWIGESLSSVPQGVWHGIWRGMRFLVFLGFLALALIIVALFPAKIKAISENALSATAHCLLWGLLVLIAAVPLALLLMISILGIPLIPLEMALLVAGFVTGYIAISRLIGARLITLLAHKQLSMVWETLIGLTLLFAIGWIPMLGWITGIIIILWGIGAVIETIIRFRRRPVV